MTYPDDLPEILFYRVGETCRVALPRRLVNYISSSGKTDAPQVTPQIPYGADAWQINGDKEWRPLSTLPKHWMPFLERERPGPLDPRPLKGIKEGPRRGDPTEEYADD